MNIEVFAARCPDCKEHLLLVLDFEWTLVCETCGYVETLITEEKDEIIRLVSKKAGKNT